MSKTVLRLCVVVGVALAMSACSKPEAPAATSSTSGGANQTSAAQSAAAGGSSTKGAGNIARPTNKSAPAGTQTGNYKGGLSR